jgi:hypothetical protein
MHIIFVWVWIPHRILHHISYRYYIRIPVLLEFHFERQRLTIMLESTLISLKLSCLLIFEVFPNLKEYLHQILGLKSCQFLFKRELFYLLVFDLEYWAKYSSKFISKIWAWALKMNRMIDIDRVDTNISESKSSTESGSFNILVNVLAIDWFFDNFSNTEWSITWGVKIFRLSM